MNADQVGDILELDMILESYPHTPAGKRGLIVALLEWKGGAPAVADKPKTVAAAPEPEPEPDFDSEPAPAPAPAKRGRPKKAPEPTPDPSEEDEF